MASLPIYETTLNILREAGFILRAKDEAAQVSGSVITTAFSPLISATDSTAVATTGDIVVTVDGTTVEISEIDTESGWITLAEAPADGSVVLVSYYYSPVSPDYVEIVRDDVECSINAKMRGVDACAPYTADNLPYCVRMITRLWTAGLLLAREYGYNTDTEQSSKDGYKKIEEAKSLLEDLYNNGGACGSSGQDENTGGLGAIRATSRGSLFKRPRDHGCHFGDDAFERW